MPGESWPERRGKNQKCIAPGCAGCPCKPHRTRPPCWPPTVTTGMLTIIHRKFTSRTSSIFPHSDHQRALRSKQLIHAPSPCALCRYLQNNHFSHTFLSRFIPFSQQHCKILFKNSLHNSRIIVLFSRSPLFSSFLSLFFHFRSFFVFLCIFLRIQARILCRIITGTR